jgi:E3 ubiquitin-protein ligase RNF13
MQFQLVLILGITLFCIFYIKTNKKVKFLVLRLVCNLICYYLCAVMVNPEGIKVHAVFVSKYAGEILKERARGKEGECCIYSSRTDAAWTVLAISLISVVVILGLLIIVFVTPRHWLHWQRTNNRCKSVDSKMVEALPCFTFRNDSLSQCHVGETCAICLEDYKDGEVLKVLPCHHGRNLLIYLQHV